MIIHQVELDVNNEVQKRGRINRTGMVNYPSYIYAISRIPAEIRRLLMLAKKLRKLDANTTGNQKQSEALSQIKDDEGNPIEDIINKFGEEVLDEFLEIEENRIKYGRYLASEKDEKLEKMAGLSKIEGFMKKLEMASAQDQEDFFNSMNVLYKQKIEEKTAEGVNDLETEVVDLRAAIINRIIYKEGLDTSPFNSSIYLEDNKVLSKDLPMDKSEVDEFMSKIADGKDPYKNYEEIVADYFAEKEKYLQDVLAEIEKPDYKTAKTQEEKDLLKAEYEQEVQDASDKIQKDSKIIEKYLDYFKPDKKCKIPKYLEECRQPDEEGKFPITEWNEAKFIGVQLTKAAKKKYSPMNMEFVFCQLTGKSRIKIKPTPKGQNVLNVIMNKVVDIDALKRIGLWEVDKHDRSFARLITGNLIEGYNLAQDIVKSEKDTYSRVIEFIKFTTVDEISIRYAIMLHMTPFRKLQTSDPKIIYNINNPKLFELMIDPSQDKIRGYNPSNSIIVGIDQNTSGFTFLGGLTKSKAKEKSEDKKTAYYSRFYTDDNLEQIANKYGVFKLSGERIIQLPLKPIDDRYFYVGYYFDKTKPDAIEFLTEFTNYINSVLEVRLQVRNMTGIEKISDEIDPYPEMIKEAKKELAGEYIYKFRVQPTQTIIDEILNSYKFEKYVKENGVVYFKFKLTMTEVINYRLKPLNLSQKDMIGDTFSLLDDSEKIVFREELKKAVADGKSDFEIGLIVSSYIKKILPQTYEPIFGLYSKPADIGKMFRDFVEGKISEKVETTEYKEEVEQKYEMEAKPLNMETAMDFVILLSSKLK